MKKDINKKSNNNTDEVIKNIEKSDNGDATTQPVVASEKLDDLNIVIKTRGESELINESGRTVMTLLMQEDGKVMSSFLGDYNKEIIKTLERVNKLYFKGLYKELFKKPKVNAKKQNKKDKQAKISEENFEKENQLSDKYIKSVRKRVSEKMKEDAKTDN